MGNKALKALVVLLSCINAATWWLYTEAPFMAILWAANAVAFVIWIADDIRRE